MKVFSNIQEWSVNESKNSPFKVGEYLTVTGKMILDKKIQLLDRKWMVIEATSTVSTHSYSARSNSKLPLAVVEKFKDETLFFIRINKTGVKWAEGKIRFPNADLDKGDYGRYAARFDMKTTEKKQEDPALQILLKDEGMYSTISDGKFLTGSEKFVMDSSGNKVEEFDSGVYEPTGYNFKLTAKIKASVVDIHEKSKVHNPDDCLSVKIDDFANLQENLPEEKLQVVASAMSKIIEATVEVDKDSGEFRIPWFYVSSIPKEDSPFKQSNNINASPFFTREQAEKHIEFIKEMSKKERLPFDANTLSVKVCGEYQRYELTFAQLIEYAKSFGIDFSFEEFMEKHKGGIAAKKFGFN